MSILKLFVCLPSMFAFFFFLKTRKKANADPRTTRNATDATAGTTTFGFLEPPCPVLFTHSPPRQIRSEFPSRLRVTSTVSYDN